MYRQQTPTTRRSAWNSGRVALTMTLALASACAMVYADTSPVEPCDLFGPTLVRGGHEIGLHGGRIVALRFRADKPQAAAVVEQRQVEAAFASP